ncbi:Arylesterase [Paramyrothecium foliicola]|nr:Arylesterase [Paramyrothecium foliicola]
MGPNNGFPSLRATTFRVPPYDPEIAAGEDTQHRPIPSNYDELLRLRKEELQTDENIINDPEIEINDLQIPGDNCTIRAIVLTSKARSARKKPGPGILFVHGGGRVMGNVYVGLAAVSDMVKEVGATVISIDYRLAPDYPGMAAVEDVCSSLAWMSDNLAELDIDPARFIIAGVSAGAGIAAGALLLSRDKGRATVCAQLLVCPMLDDRCATLSCKQFDNGRGFYTEWGRYAWKCVLGEEAGGALVSQYVAPARAKDLSGLPPAYIDAASGEPFRDEDIAYATKLWECGVQAHLHIWGGGTHGFDLFAATRLGREALKTRKAWLRRVLEDKDD